MATDRLVRWGAIAWLLSAVAGIISIVLAPSDFAANAVLSSLWIPSHAVLTISFMLFLFGLPGFHLVQADKTGRLGSIGFVLTFFGVLILTAQVIVATWILPVIAMRPDAPKTAFQMLDPSGPLPYFSWIVFAAYIPAGVGLIMMGIATMQAGVLPRWAGLLLIIATVLDFAVLGGARGELIVKLGDVAFDVAKVWIAYAILFEGGLRLRTESRIAGPAVLSD
jgi:hypothetical protein